MGLFDDSEDGQGLGEFLNEMMMKARETQYIQRWYTLTNGAYVELSAIEPEDRTPAQQVVMSFLEELGHLSVTSLGWCDKSDDPMHTEQLKTEMRAAAIEMKREWDELCASGAGDGSYEEVNLFIKKTVEGIQ